MSNEEKLKKLLEEISKEGVLSSPKLDEARTLLDSMIGPKPQFSVVQEELPDNWHELLVDAKVQHDKYGEVCEVFILPLKWLSSYKTKDDTKLDKVRNEGSIYGVKIMFGPVEEIVAGGSLWIN